MKKLKAILLIALGAITILLCSSCGKKEVVESTEKINNVKTIVMDTNEHILSIPVKSDSRKDNVQYEYHEGYEAVGISSSSFGKFFDEFAGGAIVYVNNEPVICKVTNGSCLEFGTLENQNNEEHHTQTGSFEEFGIGEHIISVPLNKDNTSKVLQYPYHEGYKVVGVSSSSHGQYFDEFAGGSILYVNTVPVTCAKKDNGYTEFGVPVKEEVVMKLEQ